MQIKVWVKFINKNNFFWGGFIYDTVAVTLQTQKLTQKIIILKTTDFFPKAGLTLFNK